jgi:hypothetical protein
MVLAIGKWLYCRLFFRRGGLINCNVENYSGAFSLKPAKLYPVGLPAQQDIQNRGSMQSVSGRRITSADAAFSLHTHTHLDH